MSCLSELLARYTDKLDAKTLTAIHDRVLEYKSDGRDLKGPESKALRDRILNSFKQEVHMKVYEQINSRQMKAFTEAPQYVADRTKFTEKRKSKSGEEVNSIMEDLESPDPAVVKKAIKEMEKLNLLGPIEAKLGGLSRFAEGGNRNFDTLSASKIAEYRNGIEIAAGKDIMKMMSTGEFDVDIAKAMSDINNKKPIAGYSPEVQKMAMALHQTNKKIVKELTEKGVWIQERKDHIGRQAHDGQKMVEAGKSAWVANLMREGVLNKNRTFHGEVDPKKQIKILNKMYEDILDGSFKDTSSAKGGFTGVREIHFAKPESFVEYNKVYGKGTLINSALTSATSAGRTFAKTELFGVNPEKGREALENAIMSKLSPTAKRHLKSKEFLTEGRRIDDQWNEVMSESEFPIKASNAKKTLRTARIVMAGSKLIFSVASTATDFTFGSIIGKTGISPNRLRSIGTFFKLITGHEDKDFLKQMLNMNFSDALHGADKYGANLEGKGFEKIDHVYRRYVLPMNFMQKQNEAAKLTWGKEVALKLGMVHSKKSHADLSPELKDTLKRHSITPEDWEVLRTSIEDIGEGAIMMAPDTVLRMTGKSNLASKLSTLIHDLATGIGSPQAGTREMAIVYGGAKRGSMEREVRGAVMQFKTFALGIPRILSRRVNNNPNLDRPGIMGTLQDMGELKQLGMFMAEMTVVAAGAQIAKNALVKGEVPDLTDPKKVAEVLMDGFQRGAMPMFANYLVDIAKGEYAKFGRSMLTDLAGPTASELNKMVGVLSGVISSGGKDYISGVKLIVDNMPGKQLAVIAPLGMASFMEHLKEYERPGYIDRLDMKKKQKGTINLFR